MSAATSLYEKGITAQLIKLSMKDNKGAKRKMIRLELLGKVVSFTNSFKPSARACNNPIKPTTLGPLLRCIAPIIFLSATVKKATAIRVGMMITKTFIIIVIIFNIRKKLKLDLNQYFKICNLTH